MLVSVPLECLNHKQRVGLFGHGRFQDRGKTVVSGLERIEQEAFKLILTLAVDAGFLFLQETHGLTLQTVNVEERHEGLIVSHAVFRPICRDRLVE